jgi:hypothetical protein
MFSGKYVVLRYPNSHDSSFSHNLGLWSLNSTYVISHGLTLFYTISHNLSHNNQLIRFIFPIQNPNDNLSIIHIQHQIYLILSFLLLFPISYPPPHQIPSISCMVKACTLQYRRATLHPSSSTTNLPAIFARSISFFAH